MASSAASRSLQDRLDAWASIRGGTQFQLDATTSHWREGFPKLPYPLSPPRQQDVSQYCWKRGRDVVMAAPRVFIGAWTINPE
jgi:hypothetical protein